MQIDFENGMTEQFERVTRRAGQFTRALTSAVNRKKQKPNVQPQITTGYH
jgi:hypothetical protein